MQRSRISELDIAEVLKAAYENTPGHFPQYKADFKEIYHPVIEKVLREIFYVVPAPKTNDETSIKNKINVFDIRNVCMKVFNDLEANGLEMQMYFKDVFETPITKALQSTFEITPF